MNSPIQDLYGDSALEQKLVFSSPASSVAGPEMEYKEDINDGELVTGSNTELTPDQEQIQSEYQSYQEAVCGVISYIVHRTLSRTLSFQLQVPLIIPGLEVAPHRLAKCQSPSLLRSGSVKSLRN